MPPLDKSPGPKFSFENDVSGRLFCWLIESGQVDFSAMIEQTAQGDSDPQSWVERLAGTLKTKVGPSWAPEPQPSTPKPAEEAAARLKAPAYNIWFRPSPSKKLKFKEVAHALLVFTGRIPPGAG